VSLLPEPLADENPTQHVRRCLYLEVQVGTPQDIGATPSATRRFIPLTGGTFTGDAQGEVLAGGADWQTLRPDGTLEIAAHYLLKTRAGGLVEVSSIGLRAAPKDVLDKLGRGEPVPSDAYYFRTHVRFRTPIVELQAWNNRLYYSMGERKRSLVCLTIFEIL
jgi:Protein of unknown function (DUF3237)